MRRILLPALLCLIVLWAMPVRGAPPEVYEIKVHGVIGPPVAQFIVDSIKKAGDARAGALLVLLDTPGGLDTAMREIVQAIMQAPLPVIVYVYPSGARAASAGTIILIAANIAAMAPGTNVGAAHPVSMGKEQMDKVMMAKVVQDAEAYAKSLAAKRGRNVEWAARAVRESVSATATEALKSHVIDVVAGSVDDLLSDVDGKVVEVGKKQVTLKTKGAKIVEVEMPFKYTLLSYITDPNVAYLLMMIGFYGILFEIYSPGAIFPGVVGGICLILAFYAFQTLPISYAGLSPGAQSGELRPAQYCGHHLHCDRLYHAHRSADELAFPLLAVHSGRGAHLYNIFPRCAIICSQGPADKGEDGQGRAGGGDRCRAHRYCPLRQGLCSW